MIVCSFRGLCSEPIGNSGGGAGEEDLHKLGGVQAIRARHQRGALLHQLFISSSVCLSGFVDCVFSLVNHHGISRCSIAALPPVKRRRSASD